MPRPGPAALIGRLIGGKVRLVQLLASGGTGHIFLGETRDRGRVALKALRAEHREVPELVQRFEREAEAAGRVRHPHVLEVFDPAEEQDGVLSFTMELLVGLDLADTLANERSLAAVRAACLARAIAEGMGAAHAAGVIHRDLKPENIFLVHAADGRETVKILDFGFSWLPGDEDLPTPTNEDGWPVVVGTPEYMAPEQARGEHPEPGADVYSLGVVLYEMIAGRVPFIGEYPAIAHRHSHDPPPPIRHLHPGAALSPELEAVVLRALEKDPFRRFLSMAELHRALCATPEAGVPFRAGDRGSSPFFAD